MNVKISQNFDHSNVIYDKNKRSVFLIIFFHVNKVFFNTYFQDWENNLQNLQKETKNSTKQDTVPAKFSYQKINEQRKWWGLSGKYCYSSYLGMKLKSFNAPILKNAGNFKNILINWVSYRPFSILLKIICKTQFIRKKQYFPDKPHHAFPLFIYLLVKHPAMHSGESISSRIRFYVSFWRFGRFFPQSRKYVSKKTLFSWKNKLAKTELSFF